MCAFESWPKDSENERGKRKYQRRVEVGSVEYGLRKKQNEIGEG